MTPTNDIEHLIKTLNIKAGAELGVRTIRDAIEATPDNETVRRVGSRSETWRSIMRSRIAKLSVAAAITVAAVLAINHFGGTFHGSNVAWGAVIKPIFNARTAVLDVVLGSGRKRSMIHDEVMGSRIRRTVSGVPGPLIVLDLKEKKFLTLDSKDKTAVFIGLEGLGAISNYIEHLRNVITDIQAKADFRVENKGIQKLQSRSCVVFVSAEPR